MEIILYQAPRVEESVTSFSTSGRRMVGWAGLLSSFRQLRTDNGPGLLSSFRQISSLAGSLLIIVFFVGLLLYSFPLIKQKTVLRLSQKPIPTSGFLEVINNSEPVVQSEEIPDINFSIVIPKIKASSKIIINVNPNNKKEYDAALKQGVVHAAGSVFPGMKGTTFLFSHSTNAPWNITRYNAVFYLLSELEIGDKIIVYFQGKKYYYFVQEKRILNPSETEIFKQKEEEILVLQTCYPPGTTDKALVVIAKPGAANQLTLNDHTNF